MWKEGKHLAKMLLAEVGKRGFSVRIMPSKPHITNEKEE